MAVTGHLRFEFGKPALSALPAGLSPLPAFFLAVSRLCGRHPSLLLPGCDELALRAVTGRY